MNSKHFSLLKSRGYYANLIPVTKNGTLLEVQQLKTWFGAGPKPVRAVDGVSFSVPEKATVAVVGESGCGKSVMALSLARLVPEPPGFYEAGRILFDGENVLEMDRKRLGQLRGREIAYVFQEPGAALNPVLRVGYQVMESVRLHRPSVDPAKEAGRLLEMVGLPDPSRQLRAYPHELSGGMQQRAMIAMALACEPKLLVADEPTTALDVTIQAQILELLGDLQKRLGMSVLLITHNLGLVADVAKTVNVMYAGRIVESGRVEDVLAQPCHPYTRGLLDAVPRLDGAEGGGEVKGIAGTVPNPKELPHGCKFAPRCNRAQDKCRDMEPDLSTLGEGAGERTVRCHFPLDADVVATK